MCEPVAGVPRVDRAYRRRCCPPSRSSSATGSRCSPSIRGRACPAALVSGGGAFTRVQRLAAEIDYSAEETNYTLALTTLAAELTAPLADHAVHRIRRHRPAPS